MSILPHLLMTKHDVQGIYQIRNVKTNESYIGSSRHVFKRLRDHMMFLSNGSHINKLLERSWKEYGAPSFVFSCVEVVPDAEFLSQQEIYWIEKTQARRMGFNRKTDQYKRRTLLQVGSALHRELENLQLGSMNRTLQELLQFHEQHAPRDVPTND